MAELRQLLYARRFHFLNSVMPHMIRHIINLKVAFGRKGGYNDLNTQCIVSHTDFRNRIKYEKKKNP